MARSAHQVLTAVKRRGVAGNAGESMLSTADVTPSISERLDTIDGSVLQEACQLRGELTRSDAFGIEEASS